MSEEKRMTTQIEQPIVDYKIVPSVIALPAPLERPETLTSSTYKIKTNEVSFYITVSDVEVNGRIRPYEVFINTKSVEHAPYLTCITRLISAFFRTGYPYEFIVEELKQIHDAKDGNYFKKGINYPSLIAEIGYVLEKHFTEIAAKNSTK